MKAKMPDGRLDNAEYLCNRCTTKFIHQDGALQCPKCQNTIQSDLVPVLVLNDPKEEAMYTEDDFIGG